MHFTRRGQGKPLVLIHGLGGSWRSWLPILDELAADRDVIALDLPGFGETPPLAGDVSVPSLADAVTAFLTERDLMGVDVVGSSMGARLVLELARRGVVGATVSLDPGGFWKGWERTFFHRTIELSVALIRVLQPAMPLLTHSRIGRAVLFAQLSARPWALPPNVMLAEMRSYAVSPSFDPLLRSLVDGPEQQGAPRGSMRGPVVIGWGRHDRVCLPRQAKRALAKFPDARLHWFERSGHFPMWDSPHETVALIREATR